MIKSILTEYGISWVINRSLYVAKLKMMSVMPSTEKIFEKNIKVNRLDIFNLNIDGIKDFLIKLPEEKQYSVINIADKAIDGIILGFSSLELDYGNPINWHYNPITKQESSKSDKWYLISDFDDVRGDIKVIWEASRLTHFIYFARAYLITGDTKYYIAFSEQLKNWLNDNPYSYGVNYKCGQECALRMINVLIAYTVFDGLTTAEDEENMYHLVEVCYRKILSNFFYAHKCIRNNHTLSEICGLIIGAWCCNDNKRLKRAYQLLEREINRQFMQDGGYIQYSFNYQRFALQIIECICKVSERTGISISGRSKILIKNSTLLMYQCQDDNGDLPNYGPNDGALIFPVTVCGYRDFRPVINTVHAIITGYRLYDKGYHNEELLWFGRDGDYPRLLIERESTAFNRAGLYTIRDSCGFLMVSLPNYKTRPSHMDGMHLDLWYKGRNIFCDSGTYSYADIIGKEMVETKAHNTVKVQGLEQMSSYRNFMVYNWTSCRDVKFSKNEFSGTMISQNGYEHNRQIVRTEHGYELQDEVRGISETCFVLFHTPYKVRITSYGFEVYDLDERLCTVFTTLDDIVIRKTYRSLFYLQKEEINCVIVKCVMNDKCTSKFDIVLNKIGKED